MNSQEQGTSFCAVVFILLVVSALLCASPERTALFMRTAGLAASVRKRESEPIDRIFTSPPLPLSGIRVQRRQITAIPSISTFATMLYPREEGILLDLEFSPALALHSCPASARVLEPLLYREDPRVSSAYTCAYGNSLRLSKNTEMLSNLSSPKLELSGDSPFTLIVAGWLRIDSLRILGSARVIVGGNVTIGEVQIPEGSDLRLHSATGMVEVHEALGNGRSLISSRDWGPVPLQGMEASLQVLPQSEARLLGIQRVGDAS